MIPTRNQIQEKLFEANAKGEDRVTVVNNWLKTINCPSDKIEKILDDLKSYA